MCVSVRACVRACVRANGVDRTVFFRVDWIIQYCHFPMTFEAIYVGVSQSE